MSTFERAKADLAAAARKYGLGFVTDCDRCGTMLVLDVRPDAPAATGRLASVRVACPAPGCVGGADVDVPASQVERLGPVRAPNAVRGDQREVK